MSTAPSEKTSSPRGSQTAAATWWIDSTRGPRETSISGTPYRSAIARRFWRGPHRDLRLLLSRLDRAVLSAEDAIERDASILLAPLRRRRTRRDVLSRSICRRDGAHGA